MEFFYLLIFVLLIALLQAYFRIADYYNIVDKPNQRSSHSYITIRGGGIVFVFAAILWYLFFGFKSPFIIVALVLIATISFIDDLVTLSSKIRMLVHIIAVSLLFWQSQVYNLPWYFIVIAYFLTIGWINAFNFMDGINGITGIYGLVSLITFAWITHTEDFASPQLISALLISVFVFLFYNARKTAKTFAGDVGSVSLSFVLAWLMIDLILKTNRIEYLLLFTIYGVDSAVTIVIRLFKKENIFEAHRTHLYQYLSNELKLSHVFVAVCYGILQVVINAVSLLLFANGRMSIAVAAIIIAMVTILYIFARIIVYIKISKRLQV